MNGLWVFHNQSETNIIGFKKRIEDQVICYCRFFSGETGYKDLSHEDQTRHGATMLFSKLYKASKFRKIAIVLVLSLYKRKFGKWGNSDLNFREFWTNPTLPSPSPPTQVDMGVIHFNSLSLSLPLWRDNRSKMLLCI